MSMSAWAAFRWKITSWSIAISELKNLSPSTWTSKLWRAKPSTDRQTRVGASIAGPEISISGLEKILQDCNFAGPDGLVVWLDYTDPSKIGQQVREFESLLGGLKIGDVVRVTVNAHPQLFGEGKDSGGKSIPVEELRAIRFQKLRERLNDYLPSWADEQHVNPEDLPRVLAGSLANAALKAFPVSSASVFLPLSVVRYADGQQMLSITGTVAPRGQEAEIWATLDMADWPFASENWDPVHRLIVPTLTVRERLFLERAIIDKEAEALITELGFEDAGGIPMPDFLESYKQYFRFYPSFLVADL